MAFGHAYSVANVEQTCSRLRFMQRIHFQPKAAQLTRLQTRHLFLLGQSKPETVNRKIPENCRKPSYDSRRAYKLFIKHFWIKLNSMTQSFVDHMNVYRSGSKVALLEWFWNYLCCFLCFWKGVITTCMPTHLVLKCILM